MRLEQRWLIVDRARRHLFIKWEYRRRLLNSICDAQSAPLPTRGFARYLMAGIPRGGVRTHVRNRCLASGRAHGVCARVRYARFAHRQYAEQGFLAGITRWTK